MRREKGERHREMMSNEMSVEDDRDATPVRVVSRQVWGDSARTRKSGGHDRIV
jgi:hypothetical protein